MVHLEMAATLKDKEEVGVATDRTFHSGIREMRWRGTERYVAETLKTRC